MYTLNLTRAALTSHHQGIELFTLTAIYSGDL